MKIRSLLFPLALLPALSAQEIRQPTEIEGLPARIAFGSCCHQNKPHPILKAVVRTQPDLFIYLGDNIYGDTENMEVLRAKYAKLAEKKEFQALRKQVAVVATWDDHDYGENDAGKEYPKKAESKEIFLEHWAEPADTERRRRPGIYTHYTFSDGERTMQVILLDSRSFRDPLRRRPRSHPEGKNDYLPDPSEEKTFLGAAQWKWLEDRLREPAQLRIIASSIQFAHEYNGWESWTNLPAEQAKMIALIKKTQANGVLFVSGDVHWGEISKRQPPGMYPLYDVTSSGLTETWPTIEPNKFRVDSPWREANFGLIEVDWKAEDPSVTLQIRDVSGEVRVRAATNLSKLAFQKR